MKYILITGGVVSGLGKGIVTSSLGALLRACNLQVTAIKIDPYLNADAGTLSPYEHGEVYVLDDGCEVDLDLGNYERFMDAQLCGVNSITTGKINQLVYSKERRGDYLGKTVQIIPHVTDTIQELIEEASKGRGDKEPDVCLIELGGTVGDIESMPFIEALRQLQRRVKRENFCSCHVVLVPRVGPSKELKTKPTQESVSKLRSYGILPDMIVCRSDVQITAAIKDKISNSCDVEVHNIYSLPDLQTIYRVPIELEKQGIIKSLAESLRLNTCACDRLKRWSNLSDIAMYAKEELIIALVGKYTALGDCYASVVKSLEHACYHAQTKPKILYIDSTLLENPTSKAWDDLASAHCLIVPGGFGVRGVEGKVKAINWARLNKIPFLGICLGFQMAVVEFARNVLSIQDAHSVEFASDHRKTVPLVIEMLEYLDPDRKMGGTMRLGLRPTKFVVLKSILKSLYDHQDIIRERHRHRYEINPDYIEALEKAGMRFVGKNDDGSRMEILELDPAVHPYFVGVQYHPEYLSRPFRPSPPYIGLINAGIAVKGGRQPIIAKTPSCNSKQVATANQTATDQISTVQVAVDQVAATNSTRPVADTYLGSRNRIRVSDFLEAKRRGEKWAMLTSYDTVSAKIFDHAKIPCLLIGDSAAQLVYGYKSTIPVTLDELIPLARAVSSSCTRALVVGDLPFGSYQESPQLALATAVRFMKEAQVHAIKLEGGAEITEHVKLMTQSGVPVMGHIGFTPQSEHALSGFKIQGRGGPASQKLLNDALALQEAGAFAVLIELVPSETGEAITKALRVPTVSIGAGPHCDAQVLVWNDMAGFSAPASEQSGSTYKLSRTPKFVKRYASLSESLHKAAVTFASEVSSGAYPAEEHCYGHK